MGIEPVSRRMATKREEKIFFDEHNTKFLANFDVDAVRYEGKSCILITFRYSEGPLEMHDKDLKEISFVMPEKGAGPLATFVLAAAQGL